MRLFKLKSWTCNDGEPRSSKFFVLNALLKCYFKCYLCHNANCLLFLPMTGPWNSLNYVRVRVHRYQFCKIAPSNFTSLHGEAPLPPGTTPRDKHLTFCYTVMYFIILLKNNPVFPFHQPLQSLPLTLFCLSLSTWFVKHMWHSATHKCSKGCPGHGSPALKDSGLCHGNSR